MKKMAEDKKNNDAEEIQGLDDGDLEEVDAPKEEKSLIKKLMLPVGIGIVAIIIGVGAFWLLSSGDSAKEEAEVQEESTQHEQDDSQASSGSHKRTAEGENRTVVYKSDTGKKAEEAEYEMTEEDMKEMLWLDQLFSDIDTSSLLHDLGMATGDTSLMDMEKSEIMTPQDSVDTLNWIDKEMGKLNKYRDSLTKVERDIIKREKKIERAMIQINQAESSQIINLARLYDGMRPEEATRLFQNLSDKIVISIIPRMKPANAAKVLAIMKPKRAARISTALITVMED